MNGFQHLKPLLKLRRLDRLHMRLDELADSAASDGVSSPEPMPSLLSEPLPRSSSEDREAARRRRLLGQGSGSDETTPLAGDFGHSFPLVEAHEELEP